VKDIEMVGDDDQQTVTGLRLIHDEREIYQTIRSQDMVIANLGSTVSGSATGTNDIAPFWDSIELDETLNQNWSIWLDLGNKNHSFGNPYSFCMRQSESMLESFTITTRDIAFFNRLSQRSGCNSNSGAFIFVKGSSWRLNICIPSQPVFPNQPRDVRVLWGFAHSPDCKGDYVNKTMLQSSGAELMRELLGHLKVHPQLPMSLTVTIPRAMPRMSALLLTRGFNDRPDAIPKGVSNMGLVGNFVEIPRRTCVDVSYGIYSARIAIARLTGLPLPPITSSTSTVSAILKLLFWR
jgi:oleate hydratase